MRCSIFENNFPKISELNFFAFHQKFAKFINLSFTIMPFETKFWVCQWFYFHGASNFFILWSWWSWRDCLTRYHYLWIFGVPKLYSLKVINKIDFINCGNNDPIAPMKMSNLIARIDWNNCNFINNLVMAKRVEIFLTWII